MALGHGFMGQVIEDHRHIAGVIEYCLEFLIEEW